MMRIAAYGLLGPVMVLMIVLVLSGGGQVVLYPDDCYPNLTMAGPAYTAIVPVEAAVPAWVLVETTVFAPFESIMVSVDGERLTPPLHLSLRPGDRVVVTVYCSPEAASMPRAPLLVVEAGVESWFTAAIIVAGVLMLGVFARGL